MRAGPEAALSQLVARDDGRRALLIERCIPGTCLWDAEADEPAIVAELLPRLWIEPSTPHPFRFLATEADRWAEKVPRRYELGGRPFEQSLLSFAVDVFSNVDRSAAFLVNQDLHGGNILRAERQPWLVIDPKPLLGERELDGVGLLRNAAWNSKTSPTASVRRWLDSLQALGLDRERLRRWGVDAHALRVGVGTTKGDGRRYQWKLPHNLAASRCRPSDLALVWPLATHARPTRSRGEGPPSTGLPE